MGWDNDEDAVTDAWEREPDRDDEDEDRDVELFDADDEDAVTGAWHRYGANKYGELFDADRDNLKVYDDPADCEAEGCFAEGIHEMPNGEYLCESHYVSC